MFKAQREQILQRSIFRPFAVNVLDAWKDEKGSCSVEYKTDSFRPEYIPHWLEYEGEFRRRRPKADMGPKGAGVIRLLLCETPHWHPLSFSMTKQQFCAVERQFDLPAATLPLFESRGSVHTWSIEGDRLYFVMKVQQQNPIANYGLSFCHHLKTGITTGILYGLNLTCQQEWYGTGYSGASRVDEFLPQLKELGHLIDHPLLLPILLLSCDIRRAQHFCMTEIEPRLLQVEEALRVTRPGQIMGKIDILLHEKRDEGGQYTPLPFDEDKPYYQRKPKMIKLMTEINTLTTESLIALCVPSWQTRFAEFLATFFDESANIESFPHKHPRAKEIKDMMNHFASAAANNMDYMQQLKSRMELQLQVLYQFMTQTDNHLNATLAAAATRDSSAMKTLAFLTALFLPGTYVATLFSMDMFSWSGSSDSDGGGDVNKTSVSSSFWIYWIVTGILTLAVIGGWRVWWKKENLQYKEQYKTFLGFLDKKDDEHSPGKDESANNGYQAARDESEDDDNDEDDNRRAIGKLRGGAGDNPDTWLIRAGHALGLDHLGMRSNRSVADGGNGAEPASTQSDLAVDVEAGLERPAEDMQIDCSVWAGQQPLEQQPPDEQHLTIPPKNRRRYSQNVPARHHHPYYLNRQLDRPASSRAVSCGQSGTVFVSGADIPPLPPPPPPPPPRSATDPPHLRGSDESLRPEHTESDGKRTEVTAGSERRPTIQQYSSINRPPGGRFESRRRLPTPPPGAKKWMPRCGNDDYSWVDGPGMKERMGAEVWEYMTLVQEDYRNSSAGRSMQRFVDESRKIQESLEYLEPSDLSKLGPRIWRPEGETESGTIWTVPSQPNESGSRMHLARTGGPRCGNVDPEPILPQEEAVELFQNRRDDFRWLDDAGVKEKMGDELWDCTKLAVERRRQARKKDPQAMMLLALETLESKSNPSFMECLRSFGSTSRPQVSSNDDTTLLQWYEEQKRKYLRSSEDREPYDPTWAFGDTSTDLSLAKDLSSGSQTVLGGHTADAEVKELLENEQTNYLPPFGPQRKERGYEETDEEGLYSVPTPSSSSKPPPSTPLPAGPLVVVPGQLERRSSVILSPHPSNDAGICSPRFPTYQEPPLLFNDESQPGHGPNRNARGPTLLPEPSPDDDDDVQQRVKRLSTHPPVVRRLSEMGLQAQTRGWSTPQIKRWKEWHLGGLARQWCRQQQRQQQRHQQRASGGGAAAKMVTMGPTGPVRDPQQHDAAAATAVDADVDAGLISPLSPIPPIRLEDLEIPAFDVPFARAHDVVGRLQQPRPLFQGLQDQERDPDQERMSTTTRQQMDGLRAMAFSAAGSVEAETGDGEKENEKSFSDLTSAAASAAASASGGDGGGGDAASQQPEHLTAG